MNLESIRLVVLACGLLSLIIWLRWALRSKRWLYAVAPLLYLVNICAFYFVRLFVAPIEDPVIFPTQWVEFLNTWALVINLQAVFTILGVGIYLMAGTNETVGQKRHDT